MTAWRNLKPKKPVVAKKRKVTKTMLASKQAASVKRKKGK